MPGLGGGMRTWERVHVSTRLTGHGFDVSPAQVQSWAVTEVLPPKIGTCRGVASRRTGFALCGTSVPREMRLFGIIKNEAGINPHTSSSFSLVFRPLLELLLSKLSLPTPSPHRWSGRGAAAAGVLKASAGAFGGCCSCRYEGPGPRLIPGECGTA